MNSVLRKLTWWLQRWRKEEELRQELQFHLEEEADERRADGLTDDQATWAAHRDLGNMALLREDTRALWTWSLLEQVAQDARYALRTMLRSPTFAGAAVLSIALGIGANAAIYSFMDAILLRALPVFDPVSLVEVNWRSRPIAFGSQSASRGTEFVMHSIDGSVFRDASGARAGIFPFPAFERLQQSSAEVLSSIFAYYRARAVTVMVDGEAEQADGEYVSGDFFRGLAVSPAAGRLILADDDRAGATPVAVLGMGYSQRRFGSVASAIGQPILINNIAFTVVGVTPPGFFGVDPGRNPDVYLPMHANLLFEPGAANTYLDENYYWVQMMGRLRPGVTLAQAQIALAGPFGEWVATTATNDAERANLPVLRLEEGASGLDTLRRRYSQPLYVLLAMVGLILAIACANTANLLLARATARRREIALRLSIGAGRLRVARQLLTESVLLASLGGAFGVLIATVGIDVLTQLLANGREGFTLHAELNWRVLFVTSGLSLVCGILFGLAPAIQSTRPALMPTLKDTIGIEPRARVRDGLLRVNLRHALVVAQIAISLLLLVGAGLFVRTLSNLHSVEVGFNRDNVLLFDVNAPQAGRSEAEAIIFYDDLRRQLTDMPGVRAATLSHASLIRAGRQLPISVNGALAAATRILGTGPGFFTTMQIPMLLGREIDERDRRETLPVAVVSDLFAKTYFGSDNPIGRQIRLDGRAPQDLEIIGVAATARYGGLKGETPPVVYIPYAQVTFPRLQQLTYALRTDGDPLRYVSAVRALVHQADSRVPVTNVKTQAAEIDQTINQEIVFARLCSAFAVLALVIACVGLYGSMAYAVVRRTSEIGIRVALGARRRAVIWLVLREVCVLAALGLAISLPIALGTSRLLESFLFDLKPNDPGALAGAVGILLSAALLAGYGPARKASRIPPMVALRND
ncbi:MAG TPA: ABC transporter permease [Vicinamibacterales bacterium]|nr:ABC transporter permease [Vicinamibacterales bacterium]